MTVTLWGVRGSVAAPGAETARYGGNTACVSVCGAGGTLLVLDAGTGIRRLGASLEQRPRRIDVLLTHLHMDHIQGLGFFAPLFDPDVEVHLWGPASTTLDLRGRLVRYLSPPLFPVHLRDLQRLILHGVPGGHFAIGEFSVDAAPICHPGRTVGYRLAADGGTIAYLPDHEPALGMPHFPGAAEWTSGHALACNVDLLIHDAQYTAEEYTERTGWGHGTIDHATAFARLVGARRLVTFHHDPTHTDDDIDRLTAAAAALAPDLAITAGAEGATFEIGAALSAQRT